MTLQKIAPNVAIERKKSKYYHEDDMDKASPDNVSLKFYTTEKLGKTLSYTKEGFLVCENVPIARTGTLIYGPGETPVDTGKDGIVRIERSEEEVLRPETIASFNGKPVTNDHPSDEVTPDNYAEYVVGVVQNARKGTGTNIDCIVADLLIYDKEAIEAIRDGKREVSCGYDADYETIEAGRGRQLNILGNHVALVDEGRCGSRCSIQDRSAKMKATVKDKLMKLLGVKDTAELMKALDEEGGAEESKSDGLQVHVHNYGANGEAAKDSEEMESPKEQKSGEEVEDEGEEKPSGVEAKLDALIAMLTKKFGAEDSAEEGYGENGQAGEDDPTEDSEAEEEKEVKKQDGGDSKTKDGAVVLRALQVQYKDTAARAEILSPGFKMPLTFDAVKSSDPKKNALCNCKRKALDSAWRGADTAKKTLLMPLLAGVDLRKAPCATIDTVFIGASELVKQKNNAASQESGSSRTADGGKTGGVPTPAELNKKFAAFWGERQQKGE